MKDNNLLRALHLAVVVSPVCLFGEYITGHTTSKRVTQAGLVDVCCTSSLRTRPRSDFISQYFMHRCVVRNEKLLLVEHLSLQVIFDMTFEGRAHFREKLPVLMELLVDMGVNDPQFESNTMVSISDLDWDRVQTQVEAGGNLRLKLSRIIHHMAEFKGRGCPVDVREEGWLADSVLDYERIMQQFRSVTASPSTPCTDEAILAHSDTGATLVDAPQLPSTSSRLDGPSVGRCLAVTDCVDPFAVVSPGGPSAPSRRLDYLNTHPVLGSPIVLKRRSGMEDTIATRKRHRVSELALARTPLNTTDDGRIALNAYMCKLNKTIGVLQPSSPTNWDRNQVQTRKWQGLVRFECCCIILSYP